MRSLTRITLAGIFACAPGVALGQVQLDRDDIMSAIPLVPDLSATQPGPTSPTGTGRPPRVGPNARANAPQQPSPNGLLGRSETTVAASEDGQHLLVGFNDAQGFCGAPFGSKCTPQTPPGLSGYAFSMDGGLTWTDLGAPDPAVFGNVFTRGDPWMDRGGFDSATFYFANLAIDATTARDLGVSVHRGHFGVTGFAIEDVRVFNAPNAPHDFYDKEALAAAKDGSGSVYVSLTNFVERCNVAAGGFGQIEVWRSHDAGGTWQGPVIVSADRTDITDPANPRCGASGVLQQSSVPAIGPHGEVYVAWQLGPRLGPTGPTAQIAVARSLDGGVSFSAPVAVATINTMRQNPPVGYNRSRINDHPRIAVATTGANMGRVYVAFASAVSPVGAPPAVACPTGTPAGTTCIAQSLVSSQIFIVHSDDFGATWSAPVAVASALPATGVKRWWPVVDVQPGGDVSIVYYESAEASMTTRCNVNLGGGIRRVGSAHSTVNTFWAVSVDGGASFASPLRLSTATSDWCTAVTNIRPNFGDYIGATVGGNRVFATWADGRNGTSDTFFVQGLGVGHAW